MTDFPSVFIAGTGCTKVGEHWDISLRHLAWEAVKSALASSMIKKPDAIYVGNMLRYIRMANGLQL